MSSNQEGACRKSCSGPCSKSRHYRSDPHIDNYDVYIFGDKRSGFRSSVGPQDYYELRERHLKNKTLFEDPEFVPTYESLYPRPHKKIKKSDVKWLRPHEISKTAPTFFADGYSRFSIKQGLLGDCWFLAAAAVLTLYPKIFEFVVPLDQDFDKSYAGIFHFRFWQYGVWVDVVVDDRLPTVRGHLLYVHSAHPDEYWSALLEKAYAKLHGSYHALIGSFSIMALEDFTGGIGEHFELDTPPKNLFQLMFKADERLSFMCTSIYDDQKDSKGFNLDDSTDFGDPTGGVMKNGLVPDHSYSITKVAIATGSKGSINLIRLRNPTGGTEWNGPFSDGSPEWELLPKDEQERLGLNFRVDGEFWMPFQHYLQLFHDVDVCNLNPGSFLYEDYKTKKRWEMTIFEDEWVIGVTAGGLKDYEGFSINPQFRVVLTETDEDDADQLCTIIVSLLQKTQRQSCRRSDKNLFHPIRIFIYQILEGDPKPLTTEILSKREKLCKSIFADSRGIVLHSKLPPGSYCVIPCCRDPDQEAQFILRVFTEKPVDMEEYDIEPGYSEGNRSITEQMKQMEYENSGGDLNSSLPNKVLTSEEKDAFRQNAGEGETIDWEELMTILNTTTKVAGFKGFSAGTCRCLLARHDGDRSTKLDYFEFATLCEELHRWMFIWTEYTVTKSGILAQCIGSKKEVMKGAQLRKAIDASGFHVNHKILNSMMHEYGNKKGHIVFEDFISCLCKLATFCNEYESQDQLKSEMTLEEYLTSKFCESRK